MVCNKALASIDVRTAKFLAKANFDPDARVLPNKIITTIPCFAHKILKSRLFSFIMDVVGDLIDAM